MTTATIETEALNRPVMSKLKQKFGNWALITGASSGIGEEFSRQIAAAGDVTPPAFTTVSKQS